MAAPKYKRILLKVSGEHLGGNRDHGIDPDEILSLGAQIKQVQDEGVQIAIVVGGGNFMRGIDAQAIGTTPATADYMGMLATMINGLALQDGLERQGLETRMLSSLPADKVCEPYIRRRAIRHLEVGRVVILAGGTGIPFFTTDTAAAVLGLELDAEVVMKATKVDGVYAQDPVEFPDAERFDFLRFEDALSRNLRVMDQTAFAHCREHNLPILVFRLGAENSVVRATNGESIGTLIGSADHER